MAKLSVNIIRDILMVLIVLIMVFYVVGDTAGEIGSAAGNMSEANATGDGTQTSDTLPLTGFFKRKGVILLAMIAGIVIIIIAAVLPKGKK